MAYRKPQTLTCPNCGAFGDLTWLVGAGPTKGNGPNGAAYVKVFDAGRWSIETKSTVPDWSGRIICPDCGTTVKAA